jgi:hypothetical protein
MRWQYLMSSVAAAVIGVAVATPVHAQVKTGTEKKAEQAATKTTKPATNTAQKTENRAFSRAEAAPEAWLKGTKLTKAERTQVNTIERKYRKELGDLKKSAAKENESQVVSKIQAIEDRERDELRAVLTPAQQTTFDTNVSKTKK